MNEKVRKLVTMAMLAALSIVLVYVIHFPIFPAAYFPWKLKQQSRLLFFCPN